MDSCVFYNLIDDPIEEYPLSQPDNCNAYTNEDWQPADEQWHYCRLVEVVATESFFNEL